MGLSDWMFFVWLDLLYGWICLFDGIFCLRHVLCVCGMFGLDGCFVWLDALFDWMLCSAGCFIWWGSFCLMVGFVCFVGLFVFCLVGGVRCTGVDVSHMVCFCLV